MSSIGNDWDDETRGRALSWRRIAVFAVILAVIGATIWWFASQTGGQRREMPATPVVMLTPPPPPPPPPQQKPPEPPKPVETPVPTPNTPAKPDVAPKQMTINGPPQAGTDSFGVQAGTGGGLSVGGDANGSSDPFGEGNYRRYLASMLQQAVQSDDKLSRMSFSTQVQIWVDASGKISKVTVVRSSGDTDVDNALIARLEAIHDLNQSPPPGLKFPALVALSGRRL